MDAPKVYVVDDDEQMRTLVRRILEPDYTVIAFPDAQQFLGVANALAAGCLVLDVYLPGLNGVAMLRALAQQNLHFPSIMITGHSDVTTAVQAMKAGAVDFIEKPFAPAALRGSVGLAQRRLAAAERVDLSADAARLRLAVLSEREREVLSGLVAGLPNKTIAYDLGLSPRTVEAHRARIMSKTQAPNFSALVRLALAAGAADKP
jgi:two-component system, LuxR family, response regulator FixJ